MLRKPTCTPHSYTLTALFIAFSFAITVSVPLSAQITGSKGQPVISQGGTNAKTDAAGTVVDVYVYNGSPSSSGNDICSLISSTWSVPANQKDATMDARGFVGGPWNCSQNPFPTGVHGRLLLGNVWIKMKSGGNWVIPSGVEVVGLGPSGTPGDIISSNPVNTVILLDSSTLSTFGTMIQMGSSGGSTGVRLKGLTVDCAAVSSCIGVENKYAGSGSTVEDVAINDSPNIGLHIVVGDTVGGGVAAGYSGPYRNVTIQYPECTPSNPCSTYPNNLLGVKVECITTYCVSHGSPIVVHLDSITASAVGVTPPNNTTQMAIEIDRVPVLLTNSHFEYYQLGNGNIVIGNGGAVTNGVKLENVSLGGAGGGIWNGAASTNLQLIGISSNLAGAILDNYYPDNTSHKVSENFLGYFMLGPGTSNGWGSCTGGGCPALLTTYPKFDWRLPDN